VEAERKEREAEEEAIIARLEEVYTVAHGACLQTRKTRERSEGLLVELLEKVIEKVRLEFCDI
jgi:hypothetical protein